MTSNELAVHDGPAAPAAQVAPEILEQVIAGGDLSKLAAGQRVAYYHAVCQSLGLNPLTKPFQYITLNSRLTLYATRDCTDQLRGLHRVSAVITSRDRMDDLYVVTARATLPDGRTDESIGAVAIGKLTGEALANALMKCETKAKRRVTLSLVGLGWLDETEVETIPSAQRAAVDVETGEITVATSPPPALTEEERAAVETWTAALEGTATASDLKAVADEIKLAKLAQPVRTALGPVYQARRQALGANGGH